MRHAASRELHAHWDRLRAGRAAPERGEIDPTAIRHALAYSFVLDVSGGSRAEVRLSGTRLDALFGRDLRGCAFDALWAGRGASRVAALLESVLDGPAAAVAAVRGAPRGCPPIDLELLLLPLLHRGRPRCRVLGSLAAAAGPTWMGLFPAEPLDLVSSRMLESGEMCIPARPSDRLGPAEMGLRRDGRFEVIQGGLAQRRRAAVGARPVPI